MKTLAVQIKTLTGASYPLEVAEGATIADLKALVVARDPALEGTKLNLYQGGRKLGKDDEVYDARSGSFLTLVFSKAKRKREDNKVAVVQKTTANNSPVVVDPEVARQRKEMAFSALQDALEKKEVSACSCSRPTKAKQPAAKRRLTSIKAIVQKLPLPDGLADLNNRFQELSVVVGFLYQQGLQPTMSGLQRVLPSLDEPAIIMMRGFAPGVVTTRKVCGSAMYSDASRGKLGATHGALAETGTSYEEAPSDSRPSSEAETIVNLHVPCAGSSPRTPRQNPLESQQLEWQTVTGGMTYGGLVYSKEVSEHQQAAASALPALIQGSRRSSQTIGPAGLSSPKSYEKGKIASEMKQCVLRWQSFFKQALLEVALIMHDDFVDARTDGQGHDPLEELCWHPDFAPGSAAEILKVARRSLARESRLARKRPKGSGELKGTFKPCKAASDMDVESFTAHLIHKAAAGTESRIAYLKEIPGRPLKSDGIPFEDLFCEEVGRALGSIGIHKLYSHQERAVQAVGRGENVIITTPTASGKSICYNVPVLDGLLQSSATALYVFPTKALAQDQLRALHMLCKDVAGLELNQIGVFDGDTPKAAREELVANARILICNPDILHVTLLPRHKDYKDFFSRLRYIVLDEAHAYRGVFGSHVALVIRRLRRILERTWCVTAQFFLSSATIANSVVHAQNLTGVDEWTTVKNDGSPCGDKMFLLWNPPLKESAKRNRKKLQEKKMQADACDAKVDKADVGPNHKFEAWRGRQLQRREGRRADERLEQNGSTRERLSPIMEMGMLLAECVQHNLKSIAFCKTRKLSELVLQYARSVLDGLDSPHGKAIAAYRAGYSAQHRRAIEGSLFSGNLRGVAATNALELGIDVGALDVTLHLGFPGTVSSLWQQAGRAGRRERKALSIYVAFDGALDQYFMKNPEKLFEAPVEHASIDYQNPMLLEAHACCASHELPLLAEGEESDVNYFGSTLSSAAVALQKRGLLGRNPDCPTADPRWFYIGGGKAGRGPASEVNLRAIDETVWTVVDDMTEEVVEEVEESKAFFQVYEGAVYMHQGKKFLVTKLEMGARIAKVRRADLKYYTSIRQHTDIAVTGGQAAYDTDRVHLPSTTTSSSVVPLGSSARLEPARHSVSFVSFMKVWQATGKVFDTVDLNLPKVEYDTVCSFIRVPDKARALLERDGKELRAGIHAASHALLNVLPLYLMCNSQDAGVECVNENETRWRPERLLIYDKQPGGTGISSQVRPLFGNILRAARELVDQCPCREESGCPGCVHHGDCPQYNAVLDKSAALVVLDAVLEAEEAWMGEEEQCK